MGADWVLDIESKIFSKVRGRTMGKLIKEYPNIRFTTNGENVEPITQFPTVYIHEIDSTPIGNDLEAEGVNGVLSSFEVKVTVNTDKDDAVEVMRYIFNAMIELGYLPVGNPISSTSDKMYYSIGRFRRTIGYNDIIDFN